MVNRVYTPEELMDKTAEWARKLADGPVKSMGIAKRMVYEAYLMNSDQALDMEGRKQARLMAQPDFFNAVLAFYQKKTHLFLIEVPKGSGSTKAPVRPDTFDKTARLAGMVESLSNVQV